MQQLKPRMRARPGRSQIVRAEQRYDSSMTSQLSPCCLQADWDTKLSQVRAEEKAQLDEAALPLRTFLMRHVMPTLTEGLMEVCKARPEDPIDFLAEYLFRENPQVE